MYGEKRQIAVISCDFFEAILHVGTFRLFLPTNIGGGRLRHGYRCRILRSMFFRYPSLCSVFRTSEFISVWVDRSHEWMAYIDVRAGYVRGWPPLHYANVWGTQVTILSLFVISVTLFRLFLSFLLSLSLFILLSYHYFSSLWACYSAFFEPEGLYSYLSWIL